MTDRLLFLRNLAQTSDFPLALEIIKAEGVWLIGKEEGEKYLDLISGIGVSNVGHCHPKVVESIKNQAEKYLHLMVYGEYIQSPQVKLAEMLTGLLPEKFDNVYLVNSGTEAIEGAMKLAKRFTGKPNFISCKDSYHGATQGALSICGSEWFKNSFRPLLPGVQHIEYNNIDTLSLIDEQTAGVIVEPIQAEAGINLPDVNFFKALRAKCDEVGALLIFDEIQTGFGRTGKMFGFEHTGVIPDVITFAKGMGGGMPIGAFVAPVELMQVFKNDPILGHITTFGGHPVSAAAALATLEVITSEKLYGRAMALGEVIKERLVHQKILDKRGVGLMWAVEFESFDVLQKIIKETIDRGVISDWFLFCDNSMRIAPPLTITDDELNFAIDVIIDSISTVYS